MVDFALNSAKTPQLSAYSSVPNKRADPNKRAGWNFLELLINVQGRPFANKCAGWKKFFKIIGPRNSISYLFTEYMKILPTNFEKLKNR